MTKKQKQEKREEAIMESIGLGHAQLEQNILDAIGLGGTAIALTVEEDELDYIENEDGEYSYLAESYGITEPEDNPVFID